MFERMDAIEKRMQRLELRERIKPPAAEKPDTSSKTEEAVERIFNAVGEYYGLDVDAIRSGSRQAQLVNARHIAQWLCRERLKIGGSELGRITSQNHATLIYGWMRIDKARQEEKSWVQQIMAIEAMLDSE